MTTRTNCQTSPTVRHDDQGAGQGARPAELVGDQRRHDPREQAHGHGGGRPDAEDAAARQLRDVHAGRSRQGRAGTARAPSSTVVVRRSSMTVLLPGEVRSGAGRRRRFVQDQPRAGRTGTSLDRGDRSPRASGPSEAPPPPVGPPPPSREGPDPLARVSLPPAAGATMERVVVDVPQAAQPAGGPVVDRHPLDAVLARRYGRRVGRPRPRAPGRPSLRGAGRRHARRRRGRAAGAGVAPDGTARGAGRSRPGHRGDGGRRLTDRLPRLAGLVRAVQLLRRRWTSDSGQRPRPSPHWPSPDTWPSTAVIPLAALPSIILSFLVATVAGALSSRLTRAVAAEAAHAAESRRQALEAERLLHAGTRPAGPRAARLAGPHGQRDGPAGRRRPPGVRRQPGVRAARR